MKVEHQIAISASRPFKLLHQTLCINAVNFDTESLFGYTELAIVPLVRDLRSIRLNCSDQCRINKITVQDGIDATYQHDEVMTPFRQTATKLVHTTVCYAKFEGISWFDQLKDSLRFCTRQLDADQRGGQLLIKFPQEIYKFLDQQKVIRVCLDFSLEKPVSGIKFVSNRHLDGGSWRESAPHLFSWRQINQSAMANGAWFPCVDSYSELCTWKIEVSCDTALTAVCSGELQEVSYTSDLRRKNYLYILRVPNPAYNIGICIGVFDIFVHPDMNELSTFCPPQLASMLKHTCRHLHKVFEFFEELMSSRYRMAQ